MPADITLSLKCLSRIFAASEEIMIVACLTNLTLIIVLPERLARFVQNETVCIPHGPSTGIFMRAQQLTCFTWSLGYSRMRSILSTWLGVTCLSGHLLASLPANAGAGIAQKFTWPTCPLGCPKVACCLVALLPKSLPGPPACLPAPLPLTHLGLASTACKWQAVTCITCVTLPPDLPYTYMVLSNLILSTGITWIHHII